jgi:hypothetical protein
MQSSLRGAPVARQKPVLQLLGEVQVPQETVRARPQLSVPVTVPHSAGCRAQKAASVSWAQASQCFEALQR